MMAHAPPADSKTLETLHTTDLGQPAAYIGAG